MWTRIIVGIVVGGLLGFVSGIFIGSALGTPDVTALYAIYFGAFSGLLICLIIEVNGLNHSKETND
jgi:ABC-type enterobactin transport system permease subunit